MFPLILTVLHRDYERGTIIPIKDCQHKGEHSKSRFGVSEIRGTLLGSLL